MSAPLISTLLVALALVACSPKDGSGAAEAAHDLATQQAQTLLEHAHSYALAHSAELAAGHPVQDRGIRLQAGNHPGETLAPTPTQLRSFGLVQSAVPEGDVKIEVFPVGCSPGSCSLVITATSGGVSQSRIIPVSAPS